MHGKRSASEYEFYLLRNKRCFYCSSECTYKLGLLLPCRVQPLLDVKFLFSCNTSHVKEHGQFLHFPFFVCLSACFCFFPPPSARDRAGLLHRQQVGSQCSAILCLCGSIITLLFYNWKSLVHWWRTYFILFSSYGSFLDVMWWTYNPVGVFLFFLFVFSSHFK